MNRLENALRVYVETGSKLLMQRHGMYAAGTALAASYFDVIPALICYGLLLASELFDLIVGVRVRRRSMLNSPSFRSVYRLALVGTFISSMAISVFAVTVSLSDGLLSNFMPLMLLFAAAIFASLHNHQIAAVIAIRLVIYGIAALTICLVDIITLQAPIGSQAWLQLFTLLMVMYLVVETSRSFIVTYRVRMSQIQQLAIKNRDLHELVQTHSRFVSMVTHEIRTPLTSISGSVKLISAGAFGDVPATMSRSITIARSNCDRLCLLVDELLDLQKLKSGNMAFSFASVDVEELISIAVESSGGYLTDRRIEFRQHIKNEGLFIHGDFNRMVQAIVNLLSNSVKFSDKGSIVDVSAERLGAEIRISVKDCGSGIPEGQEKVVFGEFSRVDMPGAQPVKGTGLGLAITKEIVEGHGGKISYVSKLGEGTTFSILLNAVETAAEFPKVA